MNINLLYMKLKIHANQSRYYRKIVRSEFKITILNLMTSKKILTVLCMVASIVFIKTFVLIQIF